jgi:glycosyltransferase involved in cell wall biosynthesis
VEPAANLETVSVVIPYYNGSKYVGAALASVRAQTLTPHEILIVDDGSRGEEAAALDAAAAAAGGCRVIHLPRNRGACVARNVGIMRATGAYIAFLDCDDTWLPGKLAKQMRFLREHPTYRAVHTGIKSIHEDGREIAGHKSEVAFEDLVHFPCPAFPSAVVMQREALFECGLFNPTKRACQDLDLFLRFTSQYPIGCVDEELVVRYIKREGISQNFSTFWHEADRVYRDYRHVFKDDKAAGATLLELHADFLTRAVYARDASLFWKIVRRASRNDVTLPRLLVRAGADLVRNRFARHGLAGREGA